MYAVSLGANCGTFLTSGNGFQGIDEIKLPTRYIVTIAIILRPGKWAWNECGFGDHFKVGIINISVAAQENPQSPPRTATTLASPNFQISIKSCTFITIIIFLHIWRWYNFYVTPQSSSVVLFQLRRRGTLLFHVTDFYLLFGTSLSIHGHPSKLFHLPFDIQTPLQNPTTPQTHPSS